MDPIKINFTPNIYSQFMPVSLSNNTSTTSRASEILNEAAARVASQKTEDKVKENKTQEIIPQPLTVEAFHEIKSMHISNMSPDGKLLLCNDPEDKKEKIYNTETKKFMAEKIINAIKTKKHKILNFSSDGKSLVVLYIEERFVNRIRQGKTVKVKIAEMKIYLTDIATGKKNTLTSVDLGSNCSFYHQYIREQNALYITEDVREESVQNIVLNYPENKRLKRVTRINLGEKSDKTPKIIYESNKNDCDFENFNYSSDGKYIAYSKNQEVYFYDIENKKECQVTNNRKGEEVKAWSPDSKNIIFTQKVRNNTGNAQSELWIFNINKKAAKPLTDGEEMFIGDVFVSKNTAKNWLYYSIPKGFFNEVYKIDLDKIRGILPQKEAERVLSSEDGFVSSWRISDNGDKIYYKTDTNKSTEVLKCLTMSSSGTDKIKTTTVINDTNKDFFKKYDIPKSEIASFFYIAENGKKYDIEFQITYPPGYDKASLQKYPLIINIHGGPNERFDASFNSFENPNLFAAQGYVVVCPNIRGSKGYNQKLYEAIFSDPKNNTSGKNSTGTPLSRAIFSDANISDKSYNDIMATAYYIVEDKLKNKIDASKICLFGFSFGGTTVNYIISKENNYKFKCAVSGAGYSMYFPPKSAPRVFFPFGDLCLPENASRIYSASAIAALAESCKNPDFRTPPLLLLHGTDDDNVPPRESKNFYEQLSDRKMDVRPIFYNKIGHSTPGGLKGDITHYGYVINWFNHHCQPEKEIYDSRTYSIYSHDGKKRLNNINYSEINRIGNKKPQNGKFAVIEFTMDFKGMLKSDMFNNGIYLKNEKGNPYPPAGILNENGDFEELKKHRVYSSITKKFRIVFDVPKNMKEFILKIDDFPAVKMIKSEQ